MINKIVLILSQVTNEIYYVGGAVRDELLGIKNNDYDIVTNLSLLEIEDVFIETGLMVYLVPKYYVARIYDPESGEIIDVTTYRKDLAHLGRQQVTAKADSLREDLSRRDFTMNAIAKHAVTGEYTDPFGGITDIKNRIIRCVGNPRDRFKEDYLRIIRALRFSAVLGFSHNLDVVWAINELKNKIQDNVSIERIRIEIEKVLKQGEFGEFIKQVDYFNMYITMGLEKIGELVNVSQDPEYHPEGNALLHTCMVLDCLEGADAVTQLAGLFHDVGKLVTTTEDETGIHSYKHEIAGREMTKEIMRELTFPNEIIEDVSKLVYYHMKLLFPMEKKTLKKLYNKFEGNIERLEMLVHADISSSSKDFKDYTRNIEMLEEIKNTPPPMKPIINGTKVMEILGICPGPDVGKALARILDGQLAGTIKTEEDAITFIKNKFGGLI